MGFLYEEGGGVREFVLLYTNRVFRLVELVKLVCKYIIFSEVLLLYILIEFLNL